MIKAVFFDMDGVLFDSEVIHQKRRAQFFQERGLYIPKEKMDIMLGSSRKRDQEWNLMTEALPAHIDRVLLREEFSSYLRNSGRLNYGAILMDGAGELLQWLKQEGYQIALTSSSFADMAMSALEQAGLAQWFDFLVTADQITQPKPEPDIYLEAVLRSGLKPQECLAVEDSALGIQAAKRAGVKVAARIEKRFAIDQSMADFQVDNLSSIKDLLLSNAIE